MVSIIWDGRNRHPTSVWLFGYFRSSGMRKRWREVVYRQKTGIFLCPNIFHLLAINDSWCHPLALSLTGFSCLCLTSGFPRAVISMQQMWNTDLVILLPKATKLLTWPSLHQSFTAYQNRKAFTLTLFTSLPSPFFTSRKKKNRKKRRVEKNVGMYRRKLS